VGIVVICIDAVWILTSALVGFPSALETAFQTLIAGLTFAMLFVLQHTQARHQAATQRKLDEILLALPGADNTVLSIENAADEELRTIGESHTALREEAIRNSPH
jgi:low affinity Fe/Cu permease